MKSILQHEKYCVFCGEQTGLHKHHCFYGTANRRISEDNGFWVWLCLECHMEAHANPNSGKDLELKIECQEKFELDHKRDDFMRLIGRNYIDI